MKFVTGRVKRKIMRNLIGIRRTALTASAVLLGSLSLFSALAQEAVPPNADAHTIITVLPKGKEATATVAVPNLLVKVDNKEASVATLRHYGVDKANLQLVMLIDDSARTSLGLYLKEISGFINALPPNVEIGIAYIDNGGARFVQPFTLDHAKAAKQLRLPAGFPGANASPYFALSALIKAWPNAGDGMRHEVVMVSNGVDGYYGLRYDPEDPYVNATIQQAQKAGVVIYSIYYKDRGIASRLGAGVDSGQNYLIQMSEATGGELYYQGFDNPVSFIPFFDQISRNLQNQYEVGLTIPAKVRDGLQNLKVKVNVPNSKVNSPSSVFIGEPVVKQ